MGVFTLAESPMNTQYLGDGEGNALPTTQEGVKTFSHGFRDTARTALYLLGIVSKGVKETLFGRKIPESGEQQPPMM